MENILIMGNGQIGGQLIAAAQAQGLNITVMTRSGQSDIPTGVTHVAGDAMNAADVQQACAGRDTIFACFHAPYDSRIWRKTLPQMELNVLNAASMIGAAVIFPESTYAFVGSASWLEETAEFSPQDDKGRIRQELMQVRREHLAKAVSVLAGDLIGKGARGGSSMIREMITTPIAAGRRAVLLGSPDVPHALTDIGELCKAMLWAGANLETILGSDAYRLLIAPSNAPTLNEVIAWTHLQTGTPSKKPLVLAHWVLAALGLTNRSMKEIADLKMIWRQNCVLQTSQELTRTTKEHRSWQESINDMLAAA